MYRSGEEGSKIVLFDGCCNLCSSFVMFLIKRDVNKNFSFIPSQSSFGSIVIEKYKLPKKPEDLFFIDDDGKIYHRSAAVLEIIGYLNKGWKIFKVFSILPLFFRDWFYKRVARNRYFLFGKRKECMVPIKEQKK